jgi:N6-L-threonylcarbamoyladenine synthase
LSQDVHRVFGGVVPELASRAHLRAIGPVVRRALEDAGTVLAAVDAVAVTSGPGLIGSLLVGVCFAKGLAAGRGIPIVGVHHLEGHVFAPALEDPALDPPFVALVVSGGHTLLLDVPEWGRYRVLGETRDDAAGEAFDKVASMLGLEYPGGPAIEREAARGNDRFQLPRPMLEDGFDFSFSGLKTAVLHTIRKLDDVAAHRTDVAASFQTAVFDVLTSKVRAALEHTRYDRVVLGGGVACSRTLTARMEEQLYGRATVSVSAPRLNADNAAMIARAGWFHLERGERSDLSLDASARMPWPGLERTPDRATTKGQTA